jgi:4-amino-4-deoxy-L-arabinose transferase-like glycosyltransferase
MNCKDCRVPNDSCQCYFVKHMIGRMQKYLWRHKFDVLVILIIICFSPLFFYKLGQSSLVSWDEAWYGEVARTILRTGNWISMRYNNEPFTDKPPGGIWLTALFFQFLGVSDFTARLSQALAGLFTMYLAYLVGSRLFNKVVGLLSAISLSSAAWFLYRARTGNLDVLLTCCYLLSIYLALQASTKKKYLIPLGLSLAYLAMIKGIVFLAALMPVLVIILWGNRLYTIKNYLTLTAISLSLFAVWIGLETLHDPHLGLYHFTHSLRDSSVENNYLLSFQLYKEYLHNGIGRWFWPGIMGILLSLVLGVVLRQRRFFILSSFFILYSVQFAFSPLLGIWHFIPLYPVMIISFYGASFVFFEKLLRFRVIPVIILVLFGLYLTNNQLKAAWYQFIDIPAYTSDEAILSQAAANRPERLLIDDNFEPAAAYYSGKTVKKIFREDIDDFFAGSESFLLITNDYRLQDIPKEQYQILKKDRDKVLVLHTPKS